MKTRNKVRRNQIYFRQIARYTKTSEKFVMNNDLRSIKLLLRMNDNNNPCILNNYSYYENMEKELINNITVCIDSNYTNAEMYLNAVSLNLKRLYKDVQQLEKELKRCKDNECKSTIKVEIKGISDVFEEEQEDVERLSSEWNVNIMWNCGKEISKKFQDALKSIIDCGLH